MAARVGVKWSGLDELTRDLTQLTPAVVEQADGIVNAHAHKAADAIVSAYPERTGKLRQGVTVRETSSKGRRPDTPRYTVANSAPLAHIFEYGTQARHTEIGADRGVMPAGKIFIPFAIRERGAMLNDLRELLRAQGATVTG